MTRRDVDVGVVFGFIICNSTYSQGEKGIFDMNVGDVNVLESNMSGKVKADDMTLFYVPL